MAIQIYSTSGVAAKGQKILTQGLPGVGKTPLIATLQPWSPIIASAEEGLLSLSQYNLPYIQVRSEKDLKEFYDWRKGSNESKQFGATALDSISELTDVMVRDQKENPKASKDQRANYWAVMEDMLDWSRKFRDLDGHVYITAKEIFDGESGKWTPLVGPKSFGPQFAFLFDCVFRMKRDVNSQNPAQSNTFLQCQPTTDAQCRTRDPRGLIQLYEPADLGAIINKLQ